MGINLKLHIILSVYYTDRAHRHVIVVFWRVPSARVRLTGRLAGKRELSCLDSTVPRPSPRPFPGNYSLDRLANLV